MNDRINIECKYCKSDHVIKYGRYKDVQRYFCKSRNRKLAGIDTIPKTQHSTSKVADALNTYYEGMRVSLVYSTYSRGFS